MTKNSTPLSLAAIAMLVTPKVMHTDDNIEKIRLRILEKIAKAEKEFEFLTTVTINPNGSNEKSAFGVKTDDDLIDLHAKAENDRQAARQKMFKECLEKALNRVSDKSIGVCYCSQCKGEKLIPLERMMSTPHTTLCPEGKKQKAIADGKKGFYLEDF